jgi:hypothetical protein
MRLLPSTMELTMKHGPFVLSRLLPALMLVLSGSPALAFNDGPPDGFAGDPPDYQNCTACHHPEPCPLNSGGGLLELANLPTLYTPDQTYHLLVRLQQTGQSIWGFELTVIDNTDPNYYFNQGGTLMVTDPVNTQISVDPVGTKDYLKQTLAGNYQGLIDGPAVWLFDWTAPDAASPSVTFYLAGNAGNGDDSTTGDCIYTRTVTLYPATATPSQSDTWGRIKALYR